MKAYSLDLRQRIVAAVEGGQSKAEVARRFVVSYATVVRYITSWFREGDLTPRTSPGRPAHLDADDLAALEAQVTADPDATLAEHATTWAQGGGRAVSQWTIGRAVRRLELTREKSPCERPSKTRTCARPSAWTSRSTSTRRTCSRWTNPPRPAP
jgi:transposase